MVTKQNIVELIQNDAWMMRILEIVDHLDLPDWWIGAGFIRSKVWDTLHEHTERTPIPDIDVIYFDKHDFSAEEAEQDTTQKEVEYEQQLQKVYPEVQWSVTNQARMHLFHNDPPYKTSEEALSRWVETATCIGAKLNANGEVIVSAPHGIEDLVNLILRPTPGIYKDTQTFEERVTKKAWLKKWPKLKVHYS